MSIETKKPWSLNIKAGQYILIGLLFLSLIGISPLLMSKIQGAEDDSEITAGQNLKITDFLLLQGNTLLPISSHLLPEPKDNFIAIKQIPVVITAYSSSVWETDCTPYITAAGTLVREGIIANNKYPFGTKIRIPEIFEDKIFVVEDRMHRRKGNYHFDIWKDSHQKAKNFGVKWTYVEILGK